MRPATAAGSQSLGAGLLRTARPVQWAKNLLVFAAPGAAGVLDDGSQLANTVIAFACFCLAASGTYFVNDVVDLEADRRHPTKRERPVASGLVPVPLAVAVGAGLIVAGTAGGLLVRWELAATLAGYVALTLAYTLWLKHVPLLDLVAVAAGFVLRTVAGAAATDVPISEWFFIVASAGALLMVTGKRSGEASELGSDAAEVRSTLGVYTDSYLTYLRSVSSGVVLVAYCLWAFETAEVAGGDFPWYELSIIPFVVAVLRYAMILDQGGGATPEDVVLRDRPLQAVIVVWAVLFGCGVYVG